MSRARPRETLDVALDPVCGRDRRMGGVARPRPAARAPPLDPDVSSVTLVGKALLRYEPPYLTMG
jgi:hypothetical protein